MPCAYVKTVIALAIDSAARILGVTSRAKVFPIAGSALFGLHTWTGSTVAPAVFVVSNCRTYDRLKSPPRRIEKPVKIADITAFVLDVAKRQHRIRALS